MIVQIYEVGSPEEASRLAALGVDHVGVLVGPGEFPREIEPERAAAIFAALPRGAKRVALSLSHDHSMLAAVIERTAPDVLHLGATPERLGVDDVRRLRARFPELPLMRSIPVVDESCLKLAADYEGLADWLLLDTHRAGDDQIGATGETHDWSLSRRIVEGVTVPVILAGGLGPDNVAEAIRIVKPAGVDSKTLTDRADGGGKDLEAVRRFVERARAGGQRTRR